MIQSVHLEKMTYGIYALGKVDGKVIFVPYGAPNEKVEVEIIEEKTDYNIGIITKIIQPSPFRQLSICQNFPTCGGCHWLHLNADTQLREKENLLEYLVKPFKPKHVYPIEAVNPTKYRNKMELKVEVKDDGSIVLGNYKYRSHDVVDIKNCVVQLSQNMIMYEAFKKFLEQDPTKDIAKNTQEIIVRTLPPQQHALVVLKNPPADNILEKFREFFNNNQSLGRLEIMHQDTVYLTLVREQDPFIFMKRQWVVSPTSFFQNNLEGLESILYTLLTIYDNPPSKGKFLDLYAGVGIQTLLLENRFEEVIAVECNESSYQDALKNQKLKGSSKAKFVCKKVEQIWGTPITKGQIAAIHFNPPRSGLSPRVIRGLSSVKPKKITYLSCNPMTFRRDAVAIIKMGYKLEHVHAFDMFPGTFHLEILGTFTRQ